MSKALLTALAVVGLLFAAPAKAQGALIEWELANPFRYFKSDHDARRHVAALKALSAEERKTPVLSVERRLAAADPRVEKGRGWARHVFRNVEDEPCLYNKVACSDYLVPRSHRVLVSAPRIAGACQWRIGGETRERTSCREPLEVEIPYPGGSEVSLIVNGAEAERLPGRLQVEDLLIVGLGDSFASGDGNPDEPVAFDPLYALDFGSSDYSGFPRRKGLRRGEGDNSPNFPNLGAHWTHRTCHRSLYSHQLRAALHLAIAQPVLKRSITFVGLACTGAEILNGLFEPFQGRQEEHSDRDPPHARHAIELSQISGIASLLCAPGTLKLDVDTDYNAGNALEEGGRVNLYRCNAAERRRKIDLLLLSVGGNDVGFSGLVANAALRGDYLGVARLANRDPQIRPETARRFLANLPARYDALARALKDVLGLEDASRVLITAYPQVAYQLPRATCRTGNLGMDVTPAWRFNSSAVEAVERFMAQEMYPVQKKAAADAGWTFVDAFRLDGRFLTHGVCSFSTAERSNSALGNLRFPRKRYPRDPAELPRWRPFNPSAYQPYVSRQRWVRTPNDAFLTANFHDSRSTGADGGRDLQITAWSAYSGAFHPTAEGHAAIAEAVHERMVKLLK